MASGVTEKMASFCSRTRVNALAQSRASKVVFRLRAFATANARPGPAGSTIVHHATLCDVTAAGTLVFDWGTSDSRAIVSAESLFPIRSQLDEDNLHRHDQAGRRAAEKRDSRSSTPVVIAISGSDGPFAARGCKRRAIARMAQLRTT